MAAVRGVAGPARLGNRGGGVGGNGRWDFGAGGLVARECALEGLEEVFDRREGGIGREGLGEEEGGGEGG